MKTLSEMTWAEFHAEYPEAERSVYNAIQRNAEAKKAAEEAKTEADRLVFLDKIQEGLRQLDAGQTISHKKMKKRFKVK